jgi:hypothetical protein
MLPASADELVDRRRQDRAVLHASAQEDPVSGAPARDDAAARDVEEPPRPEVERAPAGRDDVAVLAQKRELASDIRSAIRPRLRTSHALARRAKSSVVSRARERPPSAGIRRCPRIERPQPPVPVAEARNARIEGVFRREPHAVDVAEPPSAQV